MLNKMTLKAIKSIPGLHDIIEMTYAYEIVSNDRWYNTTIFDIFLNVGKEFDITNAKRELSDQLLQVCDVLKIIEEGLDEGVHLDTIKIGYLSYIKTIIKIIELGFDFEIQKYYPEYEIEDAKDLVSQIEMLEQGLFGKPLIDNGFETSRSVYFLEKRFEFGKGCGSRESCEMIKDTIGKLKELDAYKRYTGTGKVLERKKIEKICESVQIPREKYLYIFELLFRSYGIEKGVFVDSRSSVYDSPEGLYFPENQGYDRLRLNKILSLMAHEAEGHYIVQKNSKYIFGESHVRGKSNLFREEGLARFVEDLLWVENIYDIDVTVGLPFMLLGEVLPGEKYLEVTHACRQLKGGTDYEGTIHSFLRRKRNYSRYLPGVQHKDVTYSRGKRMVRDYLQEGGSFKALFYAKVDFEDMQLIEDTVSQEQKDSLIYPKFIAQRLLNTIEGNDENIEETMANKLPYVDRTDYDFSLTSRQEEIYKEILAMMQPYLEKNS